MIRDGMNARYMDGEGHAALAAEQEKVKALDLVRKTAVGHSKALQVASEVPVLEEVPQALVDAILAAGRALELALSAALRMGATSEELAETSGLHPIYVRELRGERPPWSS